MDGNTRLGGAKLTDAIQYLPCRIITLKPGMLPEIIIYFLTIHKSRVACSTRNCHRKLGELQAWCCPPLIICGLFGVLIKSVGGRKMYEQGRASEINESRPAVCEWRHCELGRDSIFIGMHSWNGAEIVITYFTGWSPLINCEVSLPCVQCYWTWNDSLHYGNIHQHSIPRQLGHYMDTQQVDCNVFSECTCSSSTGNGRCNLCWYPLKIYLWIFFW